MLILGQKGRQSFVAGPRVDCEPKRRSANEDLISNLRASKFYSLTIRYHGAQMSVIAAASNWDQEPNCDEIDGELRIREQPRAYCSRLLRSARHTRQRVARLKVRLGSCSTSWDYSSFPASGNVPRVGSSRSWDLGAMSICSVSGVSGQSIRLPWKYHPTHARTHTRTRHPQTQIRTHTHALTPPPRFPQSLVLPALARPPAAPPGLYRVPYLIRQERSVTWAGARTQCLQDGQSFLPEGIHQGQIYDRFV
jgi:hypothetical protein